MYISQQNDWYFSEPRIKVGGEWIGWLVVYVKINGEWQLFADNSTWSLYYLNWEDDNFWFGLQ